MYQVRYLPEGRVERFSDSTGDYYEFEDGSRIDLQTAPVWCHRCGRLTHGEEVEPVEAIDRAIAAEPRNRYGFPRQGAYGRQVLERLQARRRWREKRRSPPKCITCGSTDLFVFPPPRRPGHDRDPLGRPVQQGVPRPVLHARG